VSDDASVVWLAAAAEGDVKGDVKGDARHALDEWARARGIRLVTPREGTAAPAADPTIAERVEKELAAARDAISASDADTAERDLARIEATLRDHPELPQAAWLRAEAERAWAARWLRVEPRDEARARAAWETASALDGGRVAGVGEVDFPARPRVKTEFILESPQAEHLTVRIDGRRVTPTAKGRFEVDLAPAEHQVLASLDGRMLFAAWIATAANPSPIRVPITEDACSRDELEHVARAGDRVQAAGVTCPAWVAVAPGEHGSVFVAQCQGETCGPLLEWRTERFGATGPPQPPSRSIAWPAWATWTLVGIGAATATSMALIATGVFETRPVETHFVVGGVRQE
jgi:hypothetical protein